MLEYEVTSGKELKAAIAAAAQPTFDAARGNPVRIKFGRARYTFGEGIHETRARRIIAQINAIRRSL